MCSLAASSFCVQDSETYDRVGAHPGPWGPGGHLSMAAGITRLPRVHEAVTTPAISGAVTGARVLVWLNRPGHPLAPPPGRASAMVGAALMALAVAADIAAGLLLPYRLCRLVLDRRRLAAWESAWASTGLRWSSRR